MTDNVTPTQADIDRADQWFKDLERIDPSHETLMVLRKDFARHRLDAIATQAAEIARLSREVEQARFEPLGDNHHNAAECPHCRPSLEADKAAITRLRELVERAYREGHLDAGRDVPHYRGIDRVIDWNTSSTRAALSAQPIEQEGGE